jgi:wobble nucleotide-excising tRNase
MLGSIKEISKFGVFTSHTNEIPFLKFNLFYGWNGSGKSTLSRVFDSFSATPSPAFPEGDFKVEIQGNHNSKADVSISGLKILTFNQDFIKANLRFEDHRAKSLLYIS